MPEENHKKSSFCNCPFLPKNKKPPRRGGFLQRLLFLFFVWTAKHIKYSDLNNTVFDRSGSTAVTGIFNI
jgi:hypothetical protein